MNELHLSVRAFSYTVANCGHQKKIQIQKIKIKMAILQVLKSYFKNLRSFFKAGKVHNKSLG